MKKYLLLLLFICTYNASAENENNVQQKKLKAALEKVKISIVTMPLVFWLVVRSTELSVHDHHRIYQWVNPSISLRDKPSVIYLTGPTLTIIGIYQMYKLYKKYQYNINELEEIIPIT